MRRIWAALGLLCAACGGAVSPADQPGDIKITDAKSVANCALLGDIHGFNPWGGLFAAPGFRQARNNAVDEARRLGATHIVWSETTAVTVQAIHGTAYRCP
jgi:hypothetical protein